MFNPPLLNGISAATIDTPRLKQHILLHGPETGEVIVLIHGNVSAARFWEELMLALPQYRTIAPDLRGYGRSERVALDATRGVRDFSDDLHALLEALNITKAHLIGWSLGGNIAMQYAIDYPEQVCSLTLVAPGSPYGFGGTHGLDGQLNSPDGAGSGGGIANQDFVQRLTQGDRSSEEPIAPRVVMNSFYFKPPFRSEREDVLLDEMLMTYCSPEHYPGSFELVESWPGVSPGTTGVNNALAPEYCNQAALADIPTKPPVLWIRGDSDQIVSDTSMFDLCYLGQLKLLPGWPGAATHPPQPMVGQMRAVLEAYASRGGAYREEVFEHCGHAPHIEHPDQFVATLTVWLPTCSPQEVQQ